LVFEEHGLRHTSIGYAVGYFAILGALAPAFRYLIGVVLYQTRESVLAAGLLHGSLNAAGAMTVMPNAWQHIPAVVILLAILAAARARHGLTLVGRSAAPLPTRTG
jgi:hypothetical protein